MKEYVRTILDYPVKGIQFRDITSLLQNSIYPKVDVSEIDFSGIYHKSCKFD